MLETSNIPTIVMRPWALLLYSKAMPCLALPFPFNVAHEPEHLSPNPYLLSSVWANVHQPPYARNKWRADSNVQHPKVPVSSAAEE